MIEPTDEMVERAGAAMFGERPLNPIRRKHLSEVVAAVLAIVERDYDVRERSAIPAFCGAVHPHAPYDCERPPGHSDQHMTFSGPVIAWH